MNPRVRESFAPAVAFSVGLATIAGAWGFELIGGFVPCKLCLEERIPYYVGVPVAFLALVAAVTGTRPALTRSLLILVGLVFAVGFFLGAYHAGAEWGIFEGPSDCGAGGGSVPTNAGDILNQISTIRIVSCTEASWRFLFLSFAGWNAVVSAVIVAVALWGAFRSTSTGSVQRQATA